MIWLSNIGAHTSRLKSHWNMLLPIVKNFSGSGRGGTSGKAGPGVSIAYNFYMDPAQFLGVFSATRRSTLELDTHVEPNNLLTSAHRKI